MDTVTYLTRNKIVGDNKNVFLTKFFKHVHYNEGRDNDELLYRVMHCTCGYKDYKKITERKSDTDAACEKCPICGTTAQIDWQTDYFSELYSDDESATLEKMPAETAIKDMIERKRQKIYGYNRFYASDSAITYIGIEDFVLEKDKISFTKTRTNFEYDPIDGIKFLENEKVKEYRLIANLAAEEPWQVFADGVKVRPTLHNICAAAADVWLKREATDAPDYFHAIVRWANNLKGCYLGNDYYPETALTAAIKTIRHYPTFLNIYSAYGNLKCLDRVSSRYLVLSETEPHKIFKLNKQTFETYRDLQKRIKDLGAFLANIQAIDEKYGSDRASTFLKMCYQVYSRNGRYFELTRLQDLVFKYNYNMKRLTEYLRDDISVHQGIVEPHDGITLLNDYVRMCEEMSCLYDKYPKSLKLVHDVTLRNYSFVTSDEDRDKFAKIITNKVYTKLEYEGKDFVIRVPSSIEEIVNDAKTLHHCGDSYIRPLLDERTMLLFMRRKDEPDKPWVTIEINTWGNTVMQYAGFDDMVTDKDVDERIAEWKKAKDLH